MLNFLEIAKRGINMRLKFISRILVIFRIGGYLDEGFAWCFKLPEGLCIRSIKQLA